MKFEKTHNQNSISSTDEKLQLEQCSSGDRLAFTALYEKYIEEIYRFIYLFTKSKELSEELVQELFVKIWLNKEKLTEVNSFKSYLYRSAKNMVIDHKRKNEVQARFLQDIMQNQEIAVPASDEDLISEESLNLVQKAIDTLTQKRKEIFELRMNQKLSLDEIATQLNISKSVVKKQFYEAQRGIKQYIDQHGEVLFILFSLGLATFHIA